MNIQFSPPDISEYEVAEVVKALQSGWITTGPKTKLLEQKIAAYCGTNKAVCLNSATACLEMALRMLEVGPGDEVITSAYTYTASASVIDHVGAKIVFIDTMPDSYEMDYEALEEAITERTKVIIPVDIGGVLCDYDRIFEIVERKKSLFNAESELQKVYGRVVILADAAHSLGSYYKGRICGSIADFTSFSFHAVKNLTTAEGGALTWLSHPGLDEDALYKRLMLWTLHGQSKDALSKMKLGAWEYDIVYPAFKCNMTDVAAAIGLAQLQRFDGLLAKRHHIYQIYLNELKDMPYVYLNHEIKSSEGNCHLFLTRLNGFTEQMRNQVIVEMAEAGIACNVHFKPLPMMTAYKNMGHDIAQYPNAYAQYCNEVTLPMHTLLTDEEVHYVARTFKQVVAHVLGDNMEHVEQTGLQSLQIKRVWSDDREAIANVQKIHSECGERMFMEENLMHWADPLPIQHIKQLCLEREVYLVENGEDHEALGFFTLTLGANTYFDPKKKSVMIGKIAVVPKYWRKGIGRSCIHWIESYAKEKGVQCVQATAYTESKGAVAFLEAQGFKKLYERSTKHFIVDCFECDC